MNIGEIRKRYLAIVEKRFINCCHRIDRNFVWYYQDIVATGQMVLQRDIFTNDEIDGEQYDKDVIKRIKQHYAQDWEVSYNPGEKKIKPHFIFAYKGDPTVIPPEPKPEPELKPAVQEVPQEPVERSEILDFKE